MIELSPPEKQVFIFGIAQNKGLLCDGRIHKKKIIVCVVKICVRLVLH